MSETNGNPLLPPEEIRKLVGGYATGTLTEAERKLLFEAALEDQELFAELMREDEMREALEEPGAKAEILQALGERKVSWWDRAHAWMVRPVGLAIAGSAVAALVLVVGLNQQRQPEAMKDVAVNRPAAPVPTSVLKDEADKQPTPTPTPAAEAKREFARGVVHRQETTAKRREAAPHKHAGVHEET